MRTDGSSFGAIDSPQPRILVVDDDENDCCLIEDILLAENYAISVAVGGAIALERLASEPFDVVITDLKMPDVDGFAVLDYVARHCGETAVIVITGFASIDSVIKALRQGAYDYITKPFTPELMRHALKRALDFRDLQRQRRRAESFAMVSQMACTAAHEVFQPLTALMGHAREVGRRHPAEADLGGAILEQAERIREIISKMENLNAYITKTMPGGHTIIDFDQASALAAEWPPAE